MNFVEASVALIEDQYSRMSDPTTSDWPRTLVEAIAGLSELSGRHRSRMESLLVGALLTMTASQRQLQVERMNVSSSIVDRLEQPHEWPEPMPLSTYDDLTEQDDTRLRLRAVSRIQDSAERIAQAIMKPGTRYAMTLVMTLREVDRYTAATEHSEGDYPHLEANAAVAGIPLEHVVAGVRQQDRLWSQANGAIERARLAGSARIMAASDYSEVQSIVLSSEEAMRKAVAPLSGG